MGITALLNTPYYKGSPTAVSGTVPWDFEVAIGGHAYKINVAEYQRSTLPMIRLSWDSGDEPGERSLNTEGWWRRTVTDWSMGAGQTFGDDPKIPTNRGQYRASMGVDPWTKGVAKLMDGTSLVYSGTQCTHMVDAGTEVYVYDASTDMVKHATKSTNFTTWYDSQIYVSNIPTATFRKMCVAGGNIYAALGANGIRQTAATATTATSSIFSSQPADNIAFVNGFLVVSNGNLLYTISSAGVATLLYTHWDTNFVWNTFVETPVGIVAAGNGQTQGSFFFIGLNDTTGALKAPISAGNLPIGETIQGATFYQGVLLIGTNMGMRIAQFANGGVSYGPAFNTGVDNGTSHATPSSFSAVGQYVFFDWDDVADTYGTSTTMTGAGRVDLSQFTQPLVPAYATDVMVPVGTAPGVCYAVVAYPNGSSGTQIIRLIATDEGVYASNTTTTVAIGWVESSQFRYGVPEKKVFSSLDVKHRLLTTGDAVTFKLVTHDEGQSNETVTLIGASNGVGTAAPSTPISVHGISGESASIVAVMTATSPTVATGKQPGFLFRWTLRAALTPYRQDEILVPIIMFDTVDTNIEYGRDAYYDTYTEFQFLKQLESSRQVVAYQEGSGSYSVVVDRVVVKPYSWNNGKTFFNGTIFVRLLTAEV